MKRVLIFVGAALSLTACVDTGIPTPGNGVGREGWYDIDDPTTGRSFRCFYWSLSDSTAFWCYEPEPKEATDG